MKLREVYEHFDENWAKVCRELKMSPNVYQSWINKGHIPISTQVKIEKLTKGLFKADLNHQGVEVWIKKSSGK